MRSIKPKLDDSKRGHPVRIRMMGIEGKVRSPHAASEQREGQVRVSCNQRNRVEFRDTH
jgi:hypothetical protein